MKKNIIILATILLSLGGRAVAQDDVVTVTDDRGHRELIDMPEGMANNLDDALEQFYSKTYLEPDTTCSMEDYNPVYDKETFISRLQKLPTVMEMPYNSVVQKFIDLYTNRLRRKVSFMLGAQNFYMPIFEQALDTYGLPLELKYLPVIESGLNPKAVSRVGATGLWQFMLNTGKKYGLTVNSLVDERRDPLKSSYAAAQYLKDLYQLFGDWNLVIAAYNAGPDKINKAIHRAGGERDYWKIYPYLPKETRGYVPGFIAANYVMNYYCDHNICPMLTDLPSRSDTIVLNRDLAFDQISGVLGISKEQLRELNPQYRKDLVNGGSQPSALRLPINFVPEFIDNQDSIFNYASQEAPVKRVVVDIEDSSAGSSVSSSRHSSRRASASSRRSRSRNNDDDDQSNSSSTRSSRKSRSKSRKNSNSSNRKSKKDNKDRQQSVTIKDGETLSEIAEKNGTTVKKLRKLNGISGSGIRAGKKIRVK